jgi:hypothetical protein
VRGVESKALAFPLSTTLAVQVKQVRPGKTWLEPANLSDASRC